MMNCNYGVADADEKQMKISDAILARLLGGCSETEFESFHCPICEGALKLTVQAELGWFWVSCPSNLLHFCRQHTLPDAPAWWYSHASSKFPWID
jgi:hypothetical protein